MTSLAILVAVVMATSATAKPFDDSDLMMEEAAMMGLEQENRAPPNVPTYPLMPMDPAMPMDNGLGQQSPPSQQQGSAEAVPEELYNPQFCLELIKKVHDKAQKDLAEAREMLVRQRDKILRDRQNDPNSILHPNDPFLKIVAPRPGDLLEGENSILQEPSELQAAVFDKSRGVTTTISTSTVPTTTVNATANSTRDGQVWKWGKQSYGEEGEGGLTGEEKWGAGEEEDGTENLRKGKRKKSRGRKKWRDYQLTGRDELRLTGEEKKRLHGRRREQQLLGREQHRQRLAMEMQRSGGARGDGGTLLLGDREQQHQSLLRHQQQLLAEQLKRQQAQQLMKLRQHQRRIQMLQ